MGPPRLTPPRLLKEQHQRRTKPQRNQRTTRPQTKEQRSHKLRRIGWSLIIPLPPSQKKEI
eukprot:2155430-Amphidinium_carterae.1